MGGAGREKAEKNKKKEDIIDIEDEMTDDASVRDDASMADDISVKSDSKSVLAEVKEDLKKAKETRDSKIRALGMKEDDRKTRVKKTMRERREERERRQERAAAEAGEGEEK